MPKPIKPTKDTITTVTSVNGITISVHDWQQITQFEIFTVPEKVQKITR